MKLLDSSEEERWIITEYLPQGSLEKQIARYRGNVLTALKTFRSLVQTVASLHAEGIVHRDIKPANVFPLSEEEMVLGDFGIVYTPDEGERVTLTQEKVGPRDYMPPWAPIADRLDEVRPDFDVYMLGKLLWCMVSGRLKLFREYHHKPNYNLEYLFPGNSEIALVNRILDKCVVEEQSLCLSGAGDLLLVLDEVLGLLKRNALPLDFPRPCRVCGKGVYKAQGFTGSSALVVPRYDRNNVQSGTIRLVPFVCDYCTHFEFFAPGYPDEATRKK